MEDCIDQQLEFDLEISRGRAAATRYFGIHTRTNDKQFFNIQWLGDVVIGARRQAFFLVVLHGFGGQRNDWQLFPFALLSDLAHGGQPVHLRHHDVH